MSFHIVVDDNIPAVENYLGHHGEITRIDGRLLSAPQHEDLLVNTDALFVRSVTPVNASLLTRAVRQSQRLRFVGTATSGYDHVDVAFLQENSIDFVHAPGANALAVVDYVLSAIAALPERLEQLLAGGSVGIIGYGHIGRQLAARLKALGARICVYDPWLPASQIPDSAGFDELLRCDVLTLHPQLVDTLPWPSRYLVRAAQLAQLSPAQVLINASRGPVIHNADLLACLASGNGPQTVLDVWENEPAIDVQLLDAIQLGTPHIAGYSLDGKLRATKMLCDAFLARRQDLSATGSVWRQEQQVIAPPSDASGENLAGPELVRQLILQHVDIRRDDVALRAALSEANDALSRGVAFDALRRQYPERGELSGTCIDDAALSSADAELVAALGCQLASAAGEHG